MTSDAVKRPRPLWSLAAMSTVMGMLISGAASAAPSEDEPALRFVAAARAVTLDRWPGVPMFAVDIGTHVVAGDEPLEFRIKRSSYREPIVAEWIRSEGAVALPPGMVNDFAGFSAFTHVTITDRDGETVLDRDEDFCPNSDQAARTRPDAPSSTPYPLFCSENPFTLGGVWGIPAGWTAPTAHVGGSRPVELDDGQYTAVVSLNERYRSLFNVPRDSASVTVTLTVRTVEDLAAQPRADHRHHSPREHAAMTHADHHGTPAAQAPSLRPAAGRPAGQPSAAKGPLPDLRALPAWWVNLSKKYTNGGQTDGRDYLSFDATVWNAGTSPLVVDGFRRPDADIMDAYQYFFDAEGNQTGYAPVGTMEWDARDGHDHWHFTAFSQYRLLDASKTVAVRGTKEAFCLANTDAIDLTLPNAAWRPDNTELRTSCGENTSLAVRQVLAIGNGDTYAQYLPGQSFDITDVPNGVYYIEISANPDQRLKESRTSNNSSLRKVVLGGEPGNRTLKVPPHRGIDG